MRRIWDGERNLEVLQQVGGWGGLQQHGPAGRRCARQPCYLPSTALPRAAASHPPACHPPVDHTPPTLCCVQGKDAGSRDAIKSVLFHVVLYDRKHGKKEGVFIMPTEN